VYGIGDGLGSLSISLSAQDRAGCLVSPAVEAATRRVPAGQARTQESFSLTSFHDFTLNNAITRALAEEKYLTPTPIQAQTIPTVMTGRDVDRNCPNWHRQTAAFALPILHRLAISPRPPARKSCRILVLSPTRELSGQIRDSFHTYGHFLRVRAALGIDGVSMGVQVRDLLNGVDVLVAVARRVCACRQSAEAEHRLKLRCSSEGCDQRRARQGSLHG
jgi:ATP-dependent RNA helicase RhlE